MSKTAVLADPAMDEAPDMAAKRITIVLGDAQPIMLDGLDMFFTAEGFSVLARCVNGDELLQAVRKFQPSIVVLDLKLPGKDGLAVLRELKCDNAGTRAIVLTGSADDAEVSEALRLGVGGVVLKEMPSHLRSSPNLAG